VKFSRDRRGARLISEYADSLIVRRRVPSDTSERRPTSNHEDFAGLLDLVRALDDLNIVVPDRPSRLPWHDERHRIASMARRSSHASLPALCECVLSFGWHPVVTLGAVLMGLFVAFSIRGVAPALSANDLLAESEAALQELVGSGHGLYRVWGTSQRTVQPDGHVTGWTGTIHEWITAFPQSRLARRAIDDQGRLLWVVISERSSDGQIRSKSYYTRHKPGGPWDLVTVTPTTREYRDALSAFTPDDRRALEMFFQRSHGPGLAGERAYNSVILGTARGELAEPVVSLTNATIDGVDMHRVEIVEPRRLWFSTSAEGTLTASLVRSSETRYISPVNRFTVKVVTDIVDESGRRSSFSWTVRTKELRRLVSDDELAFVLEAPAEVLVRRAQAYENLSRMLPVFRTLLAEREKNTKTRSSIRDSTRRP
jgi:hypothetical protein